MGKKKNDKHPALCIEDIVKDRPVLTESEMKDFCTHEEIVHDALALFEEKVERLIQEAESDETY